MSKRALTGTRSELFILMDLLDRDFEVYRAMSGQSSCDLVAIKNRQCFRIEVKTKRSLPNKQKKKSFASFTPRYDVLACHVPPIYVKYFPLDKVAWEKANV